MNYVKKLNQKHAPLFLIVLLAICALGTTAWAMQADEASLSPTAPAKAKDTGIPSLAGDGDRRLAAAPRPGSMQSGILTKTRFVFVEQRRS